MKKLSETKNIYCGPYKEPFGFYKIDANKLKGIRGPANIFFESIEGVPQFIQDNLQADPTIVIYIIEKA